MTGRRTDGVTLADLAVDQPAVHAAFLEALGGRPAIAELLFDGIAKLATERATTAATAAERARVCAHLHVGQTAGLQVALDAIQRGQGLEERRADYYAAVDARRSTPLRLVSDRKSRGGAA